MNHPRVTLLGDRGYIGSALKRYLHNKPVQVDTCPRAAIEHLADKDLGMLFWCIGVTSDFRQRVFETINGSVSLLKKIITNNRIDKIVFFSSTRIYKRIPFATEESYIPVLPSDIGDVYDIAKIMGEALCLHSGIPSTIIRLSNVYSTSIPNKSSGFLGSIIQSCKNGKCELLTTPNSTRNFVHLDDVVDLSWKIATKGVCTVYNVGSPRNVSNSTIAGVLAENNIKATFAHGAEEVIASRIDISRVATEFYAPRSTFAEDLNSIINTLGS